MLAGLLTNPAAFLGELPQPYGAFDEWATWAGRLVGAIEHLPIPAEDTWREWATALVEAPALQAYNLPVPSGFAEWIDWARAVKFTYPGA